jgi:hypothetical protein
MGLEMTEFRFLCVLSIALIAPTQLAAEINKVEGFEGYKFGMTLNEALAVRPSAKQTQCDYKNVAICIEYPTTVSVFRSTVVAQFERGVSPLRLSEAFPRSG